MKFRALAVLPLAWVAAFLLVVTAAPAPLVTPLIRFEIEAAKALTLVGCVVAARAFSPGDYLRRAWVLLGACYVLLLARDAILVGFLRGDIAFGLRFEYVQAVLVTGANLLGLVSSFMLARAWHVAGLELPGRRAQRAVVMVLWVAFSVAIAGGALLIDARRVLAGDVQSLVGVSSDVSDLLSMCFVAPVFFTALALRGGLLRWPWALMTASLLFWLFYDAGLVLAEALALAPLPARVLRECFRGAACLYSFSAGLAQALALREAGRRPAAQGA